MPSLPWPSAANWALAIAMALTLCMAWTLRRWKRQDEAQAELQRAAKELNKARADYAEATRNGSPAEARLASRALTAAKADYERARAAFLSLFLLLFLASGCRTAEPAERIVKLDEHLLIVQPGDTVPDYPAGESRWWLASPFGLQELLPDFAEIPK